MVLNFPTGSILFHCYFFHQQLVLELPRSCKLRYHITSYYKTHTHSRPKHFTPLHRKSNTQPPITIEQHTHSPLSPNKHPSLLRSQKISETFAIPVCTIQLSPSINHHPTSIHQHPLTMSALSIKALELSSQLAATGYTYAAKALHKSPDLPTTPTPIAALTDGAVSSSTPKPYPGLLSRLKRVVKKPKEDSAGVVSSYIIYLLIMRDLHTHENRQPVP